MSSSSGSCGSERNRSVSHISAVSMRPREMPAIAPIGHADQDRHQHRREADRQRDAPAVEHAREDVLAQVVGAEGMAQRWARLSRAVKSISLIAHVPEQGPNSTASTINASTNRLANASLWRRKRRHASAPGRDAAGARRRPRRHRATAVADAGVEPAIEHVGNQVEDDDEAGRTRRSRAMITGVSLARMASISSEPMPGNAEDLLGDDGAAEDRRHLQRHQRHDRDQRVAHHVLDDDPARHRPLERAVVT